MKSYFQGQFNFLKQAVMRGHPGANPAGMTQIRAENWLDTLADEAWGPGIRIAAKVGAIGGGLYLGSRLLNSNSGDAGHAMGGAMIGGIATAGLFSAVGHTRINQLMAAGKLPEGIMGSLVKAKLRFGAPLGAGILGAGLGASMGAVGFGPTMLGVGAIAAIGGLSKMGITPDIPFRGAIRAMGGAGGIAGAALNVGTTAAGAAITGLRGLELGARALLTGTARHGVQGPLDAWFPFFRNTPNQIIADGSVDPALRQKFMSRGMTAEAAEKAATLKAGTRIVDPRKFAPNPRIVRRLAGAAALFSIGSAFQEAMAPMIAPPTAFFDGRHMRHVNDLGTGGGYGMGVMGRNSSMNMNYQDAARIMSSAF